MDGHQLSLAPRGGATGDRRPGAGRHRPINTARRTPNTRESSRRHPKPPDKLRRAPSARRTWQMSLWYGSAAFRPPWKLWKFIRKVHINHTCVVLYCASVVHSEYCLWKLRVTLCAEWVFDSLYLRVARSIFWFQCASFELSWARIILSCYNPRSVLWIPSVFPWFFRENCLILEAFWRRPSRLALWMNIFINEWQMI